MVSDIDLVKVEFKKPEKEVLRTWRKDVQPKGKLNQSKRKRSSSKKSVKLRLCLMVIVILGIAEECFYMGKLLNSSLAMFLLVFGLVVLLLVAKAFDLFSKHEKTET